MVVVPFFIVLILVLGLLLALAMIFMRGPRSPRVTEPACGGCGYSTTGLNTLTCPECGSDLRKVGILTPLTPLRRELGFAASVFFLTVMMGALALVVGGMLFSLLPKRVEASESTILTSPVSKQYAGIDISIDGAWWEGIDHPPLLPVHLALQPLPTRPPAPTAPSSLRLVSATVSRNDILKWLASEGIDVTNPQVSTEAARIAVAVRKLRRTPQTASGFGASVQSSRSSSGSTAGFGNETTAQRLRSKPPELAVVPIGLFWIVLWMAGIRHLWRVRRLVPS